MNTKLLFLSILLSAVLGLTAQNPVNVITANAVYTENFDSLAASGTSPIAGPTPLGWSFLEVNAGVGVGANALYRIDIGSSNTGDTYSYGAAASTDRAFGSVASGSLRSTLGARYINNTGVLVTSVRIQFNMEQWRSGGRTSSDSSEFFYGVNNASFAAASGVWTKFSALNLVSKRFSTPAPTVGALNGNDTANQKMYDVFINGLSLATGDTLYLRWTDIDLAASDDGLAIDNFSIIFNPSGSPTTSPNPISGLSLIGLTKNSAKISLTKPVSYNPSLMKILVFMKRDSVITTGATNVAVTNYVASTNLSAPGTAFQNDASAFCVLNGDTNQAVVSNLAQGITYHLLAYVININDSLYSTPTTSNGTTSSVPSAVNTFTFASLGQTAALLKWKKPIGFDATTSSVLVFAKEIAPINSVPTLAKASDYVANANFSSTTQSIGTDSLARCVYNGMGDSIVVSGLSLNTNYYFAVFVGRNADSTYSSAATVNGTTDALITPPAAISNLNFTNVTHNIMVVNWSKPQGYIDSTMTTLVFIKAGSAIQLGVNSYTPSMYANNVIFGGGSIYQFDSLAYCIYKGDGNSINALNLAQLTNYHVSIFVVRDADTSYSVAVSSNRATLETPPSAVFNGMIMGTSQTAARITWSKQADYVNARFTTLVFLKEGIITNGPLTKAVIRYTASSVFKSGTRFDADSSAFCVYKGDTNFVNVSGLKSNTTYQAVVIVVRDADSMQSPGAFANGTTLGIPLQYAIAQIIKVNPTTGVPDSTGKFATLKGIVYGFNQRFTGVQCVLRDSTGGITLFNTTRNFGYTVKEGDEIEVSGAISTNRGLAQLILDTIIFTSSGNTLKTPSTVVKVDELTESDLERVNNVKFVTRPTGANWPTTSSNISVTNAANDTIVIRVLNTSILAGKPLPTTPTFNIVGLGSQTSTSFASPFAFNGYQIIPRTQDDITINIQDSLNAFNLLTPANNDTILLTNANLNDTILLSWTPCVNSNGVYATTYTFVLDTVGEDFSTPRFELITGNSAVFKLTKANIYAMAISNGIAQGQLFTGIWQVKAESNTLVRFSNSFRNIFIQNNVTTSVSELKRLDAIQLYPNPAKEEATLVGLIPHKDVVSIIGISGKIEANFTASPKAVVLPINGLKAGIYFVKIQSGEAIVVKKLWVQ
jgi:hypothetical protein